MSCRVTEYILSVEWNRVPVALAQAPAPRKFCTCSFMLTHLQRPVVLSCWLLLVVVVVGVVRRACLLTNTMMQGC